MHNHTHSFGFVKRVLASLLPTIGGGAAKSFTEAFEAEHGKRHPAFIEAPTLAQALNAARVKGKFLVVYLPSASPRDEKRHRAFCRALTDPEVSQKIVFSQLSAVVEAWHDDRHQLDPVHPHHQTYVCMHLCMYTNQVIRAMKPSFLLWSPPANTAGLKAAAKELRARKQPFLAVVHMNEKPPRKTTVRSLHHFKVRTARGSVCLYRAWNCLNLTHRMHPPCVVHRPLRSPRRRRSRRLCGWAGRSRSTATSSRQTGRSGWVGE